MDFALPPVGEGLYEVELVRWLVQPGDAVKRGQSLMEVLSDKATMEVPAPFAGIVTETKAEPGTKIKVGQVVMSYAQEGEPVMASRGRKPSGDSESPKSDLLEETGTMDGGAHPGAYAPGSPTPSNGHSASVAAAPSVRLLARRLGIDLGRVPGTGPGGRILLEDLAPFLQRPATPAESPTPSGAHGLDLGKPGTRTKMAGVRRLIADHMIAAKRAIPHYAYIDECDFTDLVRLRGQLKESFAKAGLKLTYLPFVVKAVARALKHVPIVNSSFDEAAQEIVSHDRYHVGIAVAAPAGLMVPVIRDADQKDIPAIAAEIDRLSARARTGKLRPEDIRGGTFTVSSIGSIGGLISTPIINHPEVGILGIGKLVKRPVYDAAGNLRPADLIYLSFSFDHRIVDGAVGAVFGNAVIRALERPATLLLPDTFGG